MTAPNQERRWVVKRSGYYLINGGAWTADQRLATRGTRNVAMAWATVTGGRPVKLVRKGKRHG